MRRATLAGVIPVVLVLGLLPAAAATLPAPLHGTVTSCGSTTVACTYAFNTSAGTGWARVTAPSSANERISLQLPGESVPSSNLTYGSYVAKLTGTYTYWTVGNFYGSDANTGKVIYGTTNTNVTITAHCTRGCSYSYTTDNGTIVVKFTHAEITSSALSCTPTSIKVTGKSTCTLNVTDGWNSTHVPTGKVRFGDGGLGTLSNKGSCYLTNGTCTFTFHPFDNTCGTVQITASYLGNTTFYRSAASAHVSVTTAC